MSPDKAYYPTPADVAAIARRIRAPIRDLGLVQSALARPQASIFGEDTYPDLWTKAAALMHSLVNNHPFIDGNKRIGWIVTIAFLHFNGAITSFDEVDHHAAYDVVIAITEGRLTEVDDIAAALRKLFRIGSLS